jgi:hypothetical protein
MIGRAVKMLREEGIRSLWFAILERTVYRRIICMQRLLSEPIPEVKPRLPIAIGILKESEVDDYLKFQPKADAAEVRSKLNSGDLCIVARYEGQIANAGWVSTRRAPVEYLGREIQLSQGEAYAHDTYTSPRVRGQNISAARSVWMLRYFQGAGYKRVIGTIVPENKSSIRASEKAGYRPYGVMGYVKLGPWRRDFFRAVRTPSPS